MAAPDWHICCSAALRSMSSEIARYPCSPSARIDLHPARNHSPEPTSPDRSDCILESDLSEARFVLDEARETSRRAYFACKQTLYCVFVAHIRVCASSQRSLELPIILAAWRAGSKPRGTNHRGMQEKSKSARPPQTRRTLGNLI